MFYKKGVLKYLAYISGKHLKNSQENLQENNFIIKETLAQVFSCEFCQIFKNTFFTEHLRVSASILVI